MTEWTPVEGSERCGECLTWEHLTAWAAALVEGPLGPDGQITEYSFVEDCFVHDDSIQCTKHPSARIEQFRNGRWSYWWTCPRCHGSEKIIDMSAGWPQQWNCPEGREPDEDDRRRFVYWNDARIHGEWRPVDEPVAVAP